MTTIHYRIGILFLSFTLMLVFSGGGAFAETLNPEGVNPHAQAPKKRITLEQKKAAAEARKKKKAEISARKAAGKSRQLTPESQMEEAGKHVTNP
jgi:hypothetical protein